MYLSWFFTAGLQGRLAWPGPGHAPYIYKYVKIGRQCEVAGHKWGKQDTIALYIWELTGQTVPTIKIQSVLS